MKKTATLVRDLKTHNYDLIRYYTDITKRCYRHKIVIATGINFKGKPDWEFVDQLVLTYIHNAKLYSVPSSDLREYVWTTTRKSRRVDTTSLQ